MTTPLTHNAHFFNINSCVQSMRKILSPFSKACQNTVLFCFHRINILFTKHKQRPNNILDYEVQAITDIGRAMQGVTPASIENVNKFFNTLMKSPELVRGQIIKSIHVFEKTTAANKVANHAYGRGLRTLRDTSFALSCLNKNNDFKRLKEKLVKILKCNDTNFADYQIPESEKFTINEIYLVNLANETHALYQKLKTHCPINALDKHIQSETDFYINCNEVVKNCWKDLHYDNKTIIFFSERKYQAAYKKSPTLSTKIMKLGRHGDALHTALLAKEPELKQPFHVHVAKESFQETPLRFIELLGNEAIVLNLSCLLTREGKDQLENHLLSENKNPAPLEQSLHDLWEQELEKLITLQREMGTKNSVMRQFLCGLKWFGFPPQKVVIGSSKTSPNMVCSEFVITLLSQMIDNMEKQLNLNVFANGNNTKKSFLFLNNPYKSMCAATMTPADVLKALKPYGNNINSISPYLNAIVADYK